MMGMYGGGGGGMNPSLPPQQQQQSQQQQQQQQVKHDIFVGNLAFNTTEEQLHQAFSEIGTVINVRLVTDNESGKPKGFAFVEFKDPYVPRSPSVESTIHHRVPNLIILSATQQTSRAGGDPEHERLRAERPAGPGQL
jgi:RNA recognition motif. (a.k.a. RRM, RBD, or RNP domain)